MTGTSSLFFDLAHSSSLPNVTLAGQMARPLQFLDWALLISILIFPYLYSYIFLTFYLIFCQLVNLLNF